METLTIDATEDSPQVIFDQQNGIFEISGRSFPEDSATFYNRVLHWINTYQKTPNNTSRFVFKLEYSNTASSKFILDVMLALKKIKGIQISWYTQEDDEDMQEAGREFSDQVEIPFEFISY
jgi:hypothetical protein